MTSFDKLKGVRSSNQSFHFWQQKPGKKDQTVLGMARETGYFYRKCSQPLPDIKLSR